MVFIEAILTMTNHMSITSHQKQNMIEKLKASLADKGTSYNAYYEYIVDQSSVIINIESENISPSNHCIRDSADYKDIITDGLLKLTSLNDDILDANSPFAEFGIDSYLVSII